MAMDLDDDHKDLKQLNAAVLEDSDNFEAWEKLIGSVETLEGGVTRNSSPQLISATRDVYDRLLAKYPLFFGFWKKYADREFAIAGTEAAELVYERGIASISVSVDLWTQYCAFKIDTCHDADIIRDLFERGASCVGLDFLAHPFWDKYIEFEERLDAHDRIFAILARIIHIPMHQYARYFERFRQLAHSRSPLESVPAETFAQFRAECEMEASAAGNTASIDVEVQKRVENYHLMIFQKTQTETTKRWTYEQEIKRLYFHVTELDEAQLNNWKKYLDFEEVEGDHHRVTFLYERCLVAAAYYDEFWLRYARWMQGQNGKAEEVRHIYMRASCIYAPIARPAIRLQWALFEEMSGRIDVSQAIYEAMLITVPGHMQTIIAWANSQRRHTSLDAAFAVYRGQLESSQCDTPTKAGLVAEWARLLTKAKNAPEEARQVFQQSQQGFMASKDFWTSYLAFEVEQPAGPAGEAAHHTQVKNVFNDIRKRSHLSADDVKPLAQMYMGYLLERGTKDVAKEYLTLDRETNQS